MPASTDLRWAMTSHVPPPTGNDRHDYPVYIAYLTPGLTINVNQIPMSCFKRAAKIVTIYVDVCPTQLTPTLASEPQLTTLRRPETER